MTWPRHGRPGNNRTASAPYNFVPPPELVVNAVSSADELPDHNTYADAGYQHSGYFEVVLTTKSPLYVRCPFKDQEFLQQERGEDTNLPFDQQVKNTPDFFYTRRRNEPVIPGSSLRGMLRSVLEIISYGKVQWVTGKNLFYRTVDTTSTGRNYTGRMSEGNGNNGNGYRPRAEAGFMRQRGHRWQIEKCVVARVEMQAVAAAFGVAGHTAQESKVSLYKSLGPNGSPKWNYQHKTVWVQTQAAEKDYPHSNGRYLRYLEVTNIGTSPTGRHGEREGTLVLTGPMQRQHMAFVFMPTPSAITIDVPNDIEEDDLNKRLLDRFNEDDQMTRWQASAFPTGQPTTTHRERNGYLREGEPVFFLRENGQLTFFGRAQMFRLPYTQSPLDLVPQELRRPEDIDYAEAMFGFVRTRKELDEMRARGLQEPPQGSKARAYAGRVFVTEAKLNDGQTDIWFPGNPVMTPRILATPKPTTFQHYLVQTNDDKNTLRHYGSPTPQDTVIRGHKRYWHQELNDRLGLSHDQIRQMIEEQRQIAATDTQHTRFKPVKPEVQFKFRVYFENLSDRELGALCWVLHPLGDETKTYCHHLGMGKPLGMGAVKLEATLHLTGRQMRYASLFCGDTWQTGIAGAGEGLTSRANLEERTREFEQYVLGELRPDRPCSHLFDLKRIGMLLKTMEWPGYRAVAAVPRQRSPNNCVITDAVTGQQRPNTRYMTIELPDVQGAQKNEYRERPVLPDPSAFGTLTGGAEPTAASVQAMPPQSGARNGGAAAVRTTQSRTSNAVSATSAEVESVKRAIGALGGPGDVSRVDQVVNRIVVLSNPADQRECARALQRWLQDKKLWRKDKHINKDWHKRLEELLANP